MTPCEIISALRVKESRQFPHLVIAEAVRQPSDVAPLLLRCLEEVKAEPQLLAKPDYILPMYAFFLLAQFREERALPLLCEIMACPDPDFSDWLGDFVTEDLSRVLVSTGNGDLAPLRRLIENRAASQWCRSAAVRAVEGLVALGRASRQEAMAYLGELCGGKLERAPSNVWNAVVDSAIYLHPGELLAELRRAYDDRLVDEWLYPYAAVVEQCAQDPAATLAARRGSAEVQRLVIQDTAAEMSAWTCFNQPKRVPPAASKKPQKKGRQQRRGK